MFFVYYIVFINKYLSSVFNACSDGNCDDDDGVQGYDMYKQIPVNTLYFGLDIPLIRFSVIFI